MATAAPAAPAAPSATPASAPAAGTPAGDGSAAKGPATPAQTGEPGGRDVQAVDTLPSARTIKPIPNKSRPKLPGVDDMSSPGFDLPPIPKPVIRTPDGRFAKGEGQPAEQTPEATAESQQQKPAEGGDGADGAKTFEFGGVRFEAKGNQTARQIAEQSFRTLRGTFRATVERATRAETQYATARDRAWAVHKALEAANAEIARLRGGGGATSSDQSTQPAATGEPTINWELYREIRKQAEAAGQPELAQQWLQKQNDAIVTARLEKLLAEKLAPLNETREAVDRQQAEQVVFQHTEQLANSLAGLVKRDGTPAYPEMRDPAMAEKVGRFWVQSGLPPQVALTVKGLIAAIALYRMHNGEPSPAAATPARPTTPSPEREQPAAGVDAGLDGLEAPIDRGEIPEKNVPHELKALRTAFVNPGQTARLGFDR